MKRTRDFVIVAAAAGLASLLTACGGGSTNQVKGNSATTEQGAVVKTALMVQADTVFGTKNMVDADRATKSCVLANRYPRNSQVVWRARVADAATGTAFDDSKLDSVVVKLADGQSFPMKYGPHPKGNPTDAFWAVSWTIPVDYPTGTVNYTVTATTKDGLTASFEPFKVAPSLLTITNDVVPTIGA